jgi:hypothetical protein
MMKSTVSVVTRGFSHPPERNDGGLGPPFLVLADTVLTEAAPVFAGFEGREFLLHELWLVELWTAFAEL